MSDSKKSVQDVKTVDFQELNSIKSELDSKIKEVNELLKLAQDKGILVNVCHSSTVIDDGLLTEKYYSSVKVNLSLQM
ncbi:MAG: hypothetical protein RI562_11960 [Salibacter sp.]|uniref:hypothetical protein n=1 Tax=Salibacter sp. TaxID=2010995 RepID=UPI0028701B2F|nr:hypothetical protein [Salibacter sp.]MDR9399769.1 hypothetical protein [Salibacter sp.]